MQANSILNNENGTNNGIFDVSRYGSPPHTPAARLRFTRRAFRLPISARRDAARRIKNSIACSCFLFAVLAFFACGTGFAAGQAAPVKKYYPQGTPTRAIQALDDMLDDFIVKEKGVALTSAEENHNRELKTKILDGTFDVRELAKLSLAKHWNDRSEAERDRFVGLLKDLLEEKAIFSKEQSAAKSKSGGKYFVVYRGEKFEDAAKGRAFVRTKVVIPSENIDISINYRVKKASSDWKIYDVIVDEASLVDNYRYQFDSIIKKHGYPELTNRMQKKLDEVRAKRK